MKKSISGFLLGLIGVLSGSVISFYSYAIVTLIISFSKGITPDQIILFISLIVNICSNIVALIASIMCFVKTKVAGILFALAIVMNLSLFVTFSIVTKSFAVQLLVVLIPILFLLIAMVNAFKKSKQIN